MNKDQKISLGVGLITILIAIILAWIGTRANGLSGGGNFVNNTPYAFAEVALHKDASSCWSVIDGNVYDLTGWISQHPGGETAILSLCGKDGSVAFHGMHSDAQKQRNVLATMQIGVLKNN